MKLELIQKETPVQVFIAKPPTLLKSIINTYSNSVGRCSDISEGTTVPIGIYLLKVSNRNTKTRCGICSKLTIKMK